MPVRCSNDAVLNASEMQAKRKQHRATQTGKVTLERRNKNVRDVLVEVVPEVFANARGILTVMDEL